MTSGLNGQLSFKRDCNNISYLGVNRERINKKVRTTISNSFNSILGRNTDDSFCKSENIMKSKINLNELTYIHSGQNAAVFSLPGTSNVLRLTYLNDEINNKDEYRGLYYQGIIADKCSYVNRVLDLGTYQTESKTELAFGSEDPKKYIRAGKGIYAILEYAPNSFEKFIEYVNGIENELEQKKKRLETIIQLLVAFQCIHSEGYVHFDLKPENVQFDKDFNNIKIIDFGFCKEVNDEVKQVQGTPAYMSPLNKVGKRISGYLDFHSIGIMIWLIWYGFGDVDCLYTVSHVINAKTLSTKPNVAPTEKDKRGCKQPSNKNDLVGDQHRFDYIAQFMKREKSYSDNQHNFYINLLIKWMNKKLAETDKEINEIVKNTTENEKTVVLESKNNETTGADAVREGGVHKIKSAQVSKSITRRRRRKNSKKRKSRK